MEKGLKLLRSHGRIVKRKNKASNQGDDDDDDMDDTHFHDSGICLDMNSEAERDTSHKHRDTSMPSSYYKRYVPGDHSSVFSYPIISDRDSIYSGAFAPGGRSSQSSYPTTSSRSYDSSRSHTNMSGGVEWFPAVNGTR